MNGFRISIVAVLSTLAAGCAGMKTVTIGNSAAGDQQARGFRFYQPAPFLLVYSDSKGGVASQLVWLPDTTDMMSAQPYALLASNNATLTFSNGMLSESSSTVDETVIPNAVLQLAAAVAGSAFRAAVQANVVTPAVNTAPPPYLYRIRIVGDSIQLIGGPPDKSIVIRATINGGTQ